MIEQKQRVIDESDSAFPFAFIDKSNSEFDGEQIVSLGMSIRDYFAVRAMLALLASPHAREISVMLGDDPDKVAEVISIRAFEIADAMLKARER